MNPLTNFKWYRRARGGRWATVSGWFYGRRWVRVPAECVERTDEDWRDSSQIMTELRAEKERRLGYQDVVYDVCNAVERATGKRHMQWRSLPGEVRALLARQDAGTEQGAAPGRRQGAGDGTKHEGAPNVEA